MANLPNHTLQLVAFNEDKSGNVSVPVLEHVIKGGRTVRALFSKDDLLFVIRDSPVAMSGNQTIQVEAYDLETFVMARCLTLPIPPLRTPLDSAVAMASHRTDRYVLIGTGGTVFRINLTGPTRVDTLCTVSSNILALTSVEDKILVLIGGRDFSSAYSEKTVILKRFAKSGQPTDETTIRTKQFGTWNDTLLMPNGQFIVSYCDYRTHTQAVTWFDQEGKVVITYGDNPGDMIGHLHEPRQLAFDWTTGRIIVADCKNSRIVMIHVATREVHVLEIPASAELQDPFALHLDESRGRLYVGESINGYAEVTYDKEMEWNPPRLLVFDNVRFSTSSTKKK